MGYFAPVVNVLMRSFTPRRPMSGWYPVLALLLSLVAIAIALVPAVNSRLLVHLPGYASIINRLPPAHQPDESTPAFSFPIDIAAFERAARLLPPLSPYYVYAPSDGLLQYDLRGAAHIYLPSALPVQNPRDATWVLNYRGPRLLPRGLRAGRVFQLARLITLIELRG